MFGLLSETHPSNPELERLSEFSFERDFPKLTKERLYRSAGDLFGYTPLVAAQADTTYQSSAMRSFEKTSKRKMHRKQKASEKRRVNDLRSRSPHRIYCSTQTETEPPLQRNSPQPSAFV
jgi:hypothetical protein